MTLSRLVIIAKVQAMIPLVALMVKVVDIERTAKYLNSNEHHHPDNNNLKNAMRLFQLQRKAVAASFWRGNCLSRSLVLYWLLGKHGINSKFCIGVRTEPSFKAHAWIMFQNRPLNVSFQALDDYQIVSDYKLHRPSEFE